MKLCIRKSDNFIVNDIHTLHPMDKDMIGNAVRNLGGKFDDYYTISITNQEMLKAIMPEEAFKIYEFIKSDYLRKYLMIKMDRIYEEIDPLWLEELEFRDGTDPLYKLYANKILKRIQDIIKKVNGWVFRAEERHIGEDGKLYIKLCEKDKKKLGIDTMQPEGFIIAKQGQLLLT